MVFLVSPPPQGAMFPSPRAAAPYGHAYGDGSPRSHNPKQYRNTHYTLGATHSVPHRKRRCLRRLSAAGQTHKLSCAIVCSTHEMHNRPHRSLYGDAQTAAKAHS